MLGICSTGRGRLSVGTGLVIGILLVPAAVHAHFYLVAPTNWVSSNTTSGAPEKMAPCGNESGGLADGGMSVVNGFSANADGTTTVTVTIHEVVPHAGWYRVSLVPGRSSAQTTSSLPDPPTPPTTCAATIASPVSLPIVADGLLTHQSAFPGPQSAQVTLPANISCTSANPCTLQIVEVMNDGAHFPPGCFYHHCADIMIARDGGTGGGQVDAAASSSGSASDSGVVNGGYDAGLADGSSGGGASSSSGVSASNGSSGAGGSGGVSASSGSGGMTGGSSGAAGSSGAIAGGNGADASTGGGMPPAGGCGCVLSKGATTPAALGLTGLLSIAILRRRRRRNAR